MLKIRVNGEDMDIPLLKDIVTIFGLAVVVLWVCTRFRLPAIVGLLFTGIICGPCCLALVKDIKDVNTLAEIGIMLLLFTIGLEFSLTRLKEIRRTFFLGGMLQISLTVLISFCFAQLLSRPFGESLFLGFLLSMSSTAIVLKSMEAKDEVDSPQGRLIVGILIFQDVIAVPMMLVTPALSGKQFTWDPQLLVPLIGGLAAIALVFIAAINVVPYILYHLAKTRSRELFTLCVLTICFAVAWLASSIGLSLAIGAFLAGLIISNSDYRHEALGNILPLQDIFLSLFFVSIGMLLDIQFVMQYPLIILLATFGVMLMKSFVVVLTAKVLGFSLRAMILSGLALSQIGEFSFVLAKAGNENGLAMDFHYQLFLAVALLSMALTPGLISYSHSIAEFLAKLPLPEKWKTGLEPNHTKENVKHENHIVIVGFGIVGRQLASAAKDVNIPYVIIEMNPETVKIEKEKGEPIFFGDATHESMLRFLQVPKARVVAIMINDLQASRRTVQMSRLLNPEAYIIVRARYIQEMKILQQLGAVDVIPDEFGTSIEMFIHVLHQFKISDENIAKSVKNLREYKDAIANEI